MQTIDPSLRQAAVLTKHWTTGDVEAVTLLLAETSNEEAADLVIAMLVLREHSQEEITRIIESTMG